jgi:glycine hydroxymethyltransferase
LISNYHNNRIAALAVTLAEAACFGRAFASQIVENARSLAQALASNGLAVVGKPPRYTDSHIVIIDPTMLQGGDTAFRRLEAARILTTRVQLPKTFPERRGLRLGTPAITRSGMAAREMGTIAALIRRVLIDQEAPEQVATDAARLAEAFPGVRYCFEAHASPSPRTNRLS